MYALYKLVKIALCIRLYQMLTPTLSRSAAKTHVEYISGPVRIKDALYMGDELAAKDMDFIASNKVTHIINTVVKRIPNLYEKYGIQYLSVNWTEKEQNIFDRKNNAINMIINFIEEAMEEGQSVLVHSMHGKSRAGCVILAYLMKKYSWSLQKSFDYVVSKKDSFKIKSNFMSQLTQLEKRIMQNQNLSTGWLSASNQDDLVMLNTFKNVKSCLILQKQLPKKGKKRVSWGQKVTIGPDYKSQAHNSLTSTSRYKQFRDQIVAKKLRPILKNCGGEQKQDQQNFSQSIESLQVSPTKQNSKRIENSKTVAIHQERLSKSQAIGSNKSNVSAYVVVNNFMDKTRSQRYSSIPTRQNGRQKKLQSKSGSRLAPYQNVISSMRSPYDINYLNRVGESTKLRKKQDPRQYIRNFNTDERPYSVKFEQQKTTPTRTTTGKLNPKEQILYNSSYNYKNKQVWPVQRQGIIRYK